MAGAVDVLERVGLFQGFEREELERIVARGQTVGFPDGAIVFQEGDPGEGFYVVLRGAVRISKALPNAGDETLNVIKPGDFFGEMALLDDLPRSATAVAQDGCQVFVLKAADFLDLTYSEPALGCKLLWALCRTFSRRLREATESMASLLKMSRAY